MITPAKKANSIQERWTQLDAERTGILTRCEQYSEWTLPWVLPPSGTVPTEVLPKSGGSIGARCVNHLSNHIVQVLFPANRAFFRSQPGKETKAAAQAAGLQESDLDLILAGIERTSMLSTNIATHRSKAVDLAKHLIILGNALPYYYRDAQGLLKVTVYNYRDYVVKRKWDGGVLELITRDKKQLSSFNADAQAVIKAAKPGTTDEQECTLYTYVKWDATIRKYRVTQAADQVDLKLAEEVLYPEKLLPWIPLTWHRKHGEDYGRGLVEDYEMTFNSHAELTLAYNQLIAIMADIKRFVNPQSVVDVEELENSEPGSYHPAAPGDVWTPDMGKAFDLQAVNMRVRELEQELGAAFMLSTATTRQAERVTAEEIKMQIAELETSHGGIYSKLADEWQTPLAHIILNMEGISPEHDITPFIITGMDALSRSAESEAVYLVFQDLSVTQQLGTWGRWLDEDKYLSTACTNRGVDKAKFFKDKEVVKQEDQARMQAEQQAMQREAQTKLQAEAMKQ